jgi:hypothetical protein
MHPLLTTASRPFFRHGVPLMDSTLGSNGHANWGDPKPDGPWTQHLYLDKNGDPSVAIVLDLHSSFLVNLHCWKNNETGAVIHFDGHCKGVINANNHELFTFEFLHQFLRQCLNTSQSFRGYLSTSIDHWCRGAKACRDTLPELWRRLRVYKQRALKESLSRRLEKLFVCSFFDYISLQHQHVDFDPYADYTCHCHDHSTTSLKVFFLYDNGCNVLRYALNRSPETIKEVIWLVDRLHWANHNTCSPFLDSGAWPFLQGVNTQVAEQKNRVTKFLQRCSAYLSWPRQLVLQHFLLGWVNQYQDLQNRSLPVPLSRDIPARCIIADGVMVSMRLSEFHGTRPYISARNVSSGVPASARLMFGDAGHRKTLDTLISQHYHVSRMKASLEEPLKAFMRFLVSRPELRRFISLTVLVLLLSWV